LSIDRIAGRPRISNQTTPSRKWHINSLPTELLIKIFQNFCGFVDRPISLSLVCHLWHAIVTACPDLWTSIVFERSKGTHSIYRTRGRPILCRSWSSLERTLTRTGTGTLSLSFHLGTILCPHDEEERALRLFGRCHDLRIRLYAMDRYTFASSITMPHLEHIELHIEKEVHIEPLLDSIERKSPRLRSLRILGFFPTDLAQHRSLLRRIVHLGLIFIGNCDISFQGLQNVEELR
jgi:hypothetical protein